jgi:hypothetical protein
VTWPDASVGTVTDVSSVSIVEPEDDVTNRKSPVTASNLTERPTKGAPACESLAVTTASPPEQIAGAQLSPCVDDGVIVTSLLTVPGRTVNVAVAGVAVPVSLIVSVSGVSAPTLFGTTVSVLPVIGPASGSTFWLLEVAT